MRFRDREHAGWLLAKKLECFAAERPIIVGLTRGGMPVAFEVARGLGAPLDLIVVRRIDAQDPGDLPIGAIAEGGETFLNPTVLRDARLPHEDPAARAEWEAVELARCVRLYRDKYPALDIAGRTVIVVDDFVATGATASAAGRAARQRGAARVVLAVPVVGAAGEVELQGTFDEVIALEQASQPLVLSDWYERFEEVTDDSALQYLHRARIELPANHEDSELWDGEWIESQATGPTVKR